MDLWQTPRPEPSLADLAGAAVPFPTWRKAPTPVRMLGGGSLTKGGREEKTREKLGKKAGKIEMRRKQSIFGGEVDDDDRFIIFC